MRKLVSEFLEEVGKSEDKVAAIKAAATQNPAIVDVIKVAFDPDWEFNLSPSYPDKFKLDRTTPAGLSITELIKDRKKLQIFRKFGPYATLDQSRRETIFLNFLESLHFSEAEVLVFAKDRALEELYPWLNRDFYNVLFGISEPKKVEVVEEKEEPKSEPQEVSEKPTEKVEEVKNEDSKPAEKPKRRGRPKKSDSQ